MAPELGTWGPVVAACTRLDPAQRCTLPALAAYLADNAAELGAELGGGPAASPAPANSVLVSSVNPARDPIMAGGALGAGADAASAGGIAATCDPHAQQAHAAQPLWHGAWGGATGLLAQKAAGDSVDVNGTRNGPCAGPGALPEAAPLPVTSIAAATLRGGSGTCFRVAAAQIAPGESLAMACMGRGVGGTYEQPAAHPCSMVWSPRGGAPAQPQASGAELGDRVYPCSTGWSPWGGVPAQPPLHVATPEPDAASNAQLAAACGAIEAFVAAQRGFLASPAHAGAAALEDARLALVAACVPQEVPQGGWPTSGIVPPSAAGAGAGAGQAGPTLAEAALTLERGRLASVRACQPARTAQQGSRASAAPYEGAQWGADISGGSRGLRRARLRQRRRAEPYTRAPRASGLQTWGAAGRQAGVPAGLAGPHAWGPYATATRAGDWRLTRAAAVCWRCTPHGRWRPEQGRRRARCAATWAPWSKAANSRCRC